MASRSTLPVDCRIQGPAFVAGVRGFLRERGGWALPLFDGEVQTFVNQVYQRADAFLFGRRTYEIFAGYWGAIADPGNPIAGPLNARPKYVASTTLTTRSGRTRPSCPVTSRGPSAS
jgi:dihydrofolate reductase